MTGEKLGRKLDKIVELLNEAENILAILRGEVAIYDALSATSLLPLDPGGKAEEQSVSPWLRSEDFVSGRKVTYLGSSKSTESKYKDPITGFIWKHHYSDHETNRQRYHENNSRYLLRVLDKLGHNSVGILKSERVEYEPGKFAWNWKWSQPAEDQTLPQYVPTKET
jgi:hypothetical protein